VTPFGMDSPPPTAKGGMQNLRATLSQRTARRDDVKLLRSFLSVTKVLAPAHTVRTLLTPATEHAVSIEPHPLVLSSMTYHADIFYRRNCF
jgi:hypothetical protein